MVAFLISGNADRPGRVFARGQAYADYNDMMSLTEDIVRACAREACGTMQARPPHTHTARWILALVRVESTAQHISVGSSMQVKYQDKVIDVESPFRRATMHELVEQATGVGPPPCPCHLRSHCCENIVQWHQAQDFGRSDSFVGVQGFRLKDLTSSVPGRRGCRPLMLPSHRRESNMQLPAPQASDTS